MAPRETAATGSPPAGVVAFSVPRRFLVNLTLKGFIKDAQRSNDKLILPVTLTNVELANGLLTPLLKLLFGEWLSPARWSAAIPALELPASFAQTVDIPATTVDVAGEVPMTVTTQAMQLPLNFAT